MGVNLQQLDDAGLTARVADGDPDAAEVLYDRYSTPAYSLALHLAGDPQRAGELVQQAFNRVWAGASRFNAETGRFSTWLFSLVNYLAQATPVAQARLVPVPVQARNSNRPITSPLQPLPVPVGCRHK
jgi:DNA-directed RNA polymerase specialized sigma24 family protein